MDLFVYGTLQSRALMGAVAGGQVAQAVTAALDGYRIYPKKNDVVPLIAEDRDQTARGVVYTNLDHAQMLRLNTYEGAFGYTLQKVCVETNSGPMTVSCYLPPSSIQAEDGQWSYEDWQIHHEAPAIYAAV